MLDSALGGDEGGSAMCGVYVGIRRWARAGIWWKGGQRCGAEGRRRNQRDANSRVAAMMSRQVLGISGSPLRVCRWWRCDSGAPSQINKPPQQCASAVAQQAGGRAYQGTSQSRGGEEKKSAVVVVSSSVEIVVAGDGDTYLGRVCRGCRRSSVVGVGRMLSMLKERGASQGEDVFLGVVFCRSLASHGANESTMRRPGNRAHAPGPTVATKSFNSKLGSGPHSSSISSTRDEGILFYSSSTTVKHRSSKPSCLLFFFRKAE